MRWMTAAAMLGIASFLPPVSQSQSPPSPSHSGPSYTPPRTSFGDPSLEGVWNHNFLIVMEAKGDPPPPLVLSEDDARGMANKLAGQIGGSYDRLLDPEVPELMKSVDGLPLVRGQRRTRTVVQPADGRIPYTAAGRQASRSTGLSGYDNPEDRPNWERCVTGLGLPPVTGVGVTNTNPRQIVQTPGFVVIFTEYGNEARIIPLTSVHKPKPLRDLLGDSIARWDGDELVIETIDLPAKDRLRAFSDLVVSNSATVTERFSRISENELLYQYTVEDPAIYSAPWLAEYSLYQTAQPMFEHACHEGNYSLPNILKGARAAERKK